MGLGQNPGVAGGEVSVAAISGDDEWDSLPRCAANEAEFPEPR